MKITAPPLTPLEFDAEPKAINSMPTRITAKAMKNSQVANGICDENAGGAAEISFAWHSEHDMRTGSMQLLQATRPHSWQT